MIDSSNLIAKYCPAGVCFRPLGDLVDYEQPTKYLVASTAYSDTYATPVLTAGQSFILGHTDEHEGVYPASPDNPVVIFDDFTTAFKWVDFPFKAKSSAMKMLTPKVDGGVLLRYVYYAMQTITYRPQDHARQWIGTYASFRIPVPPLEVQREIVRILDQFTQLKAELEAELEAELAARHRQYAHYRESLMIFDSVGGAPTHAMGELGTFIRGRRFTKDDVVTEGIPSIHYGEIYTRYGAWAANTVSQVRLEIRPRLRFAQPGDLVIAGVGETVEDVGKAVAWLGDGEVAIHDDCFTYRHEMNPKFVSYYFQTSAFHAQKAKYVARAKVKRLSSEGLSKISIPVPSLDEQERIVAVLDNFDALMDDLTVALPAELDARRKQYEYHRDRLLTFEEAPV